MQRQRASTIATLLALAVTTIHGDHPDAKVWSMDEAMSNIPNATIPDGKYRISVGERGVGRGNFLYIKKKHEEAMDIAKDNLLFGAPLGVIGLVLAIVAKRQTYGIMPVLASMVAGTAVVGTLMLPYGYLKSDNQLALAVDRSDVFQVFSHEEALNVIQLNQVVGMRNDQGDVVVNASMMKNDHLTIQGQQDQRPISMIAKKVVHPSIIVPPQDYLVYLQYFTKGTEGMQWVHTADGKQIAASEFRLTAWRFTPALEFDATDNSGNYIMHH